MMFLSGRLYLTPSFCCFFLTPKEIVLMKLVATERKQLLFVTIKGRNCLKLSLIIHRAIYLIPTYDLDAIIIVSIL